MTSHLAENFYEVEDNNDYNRQQYSSTPLKSPQSTNGFRPKEDYEREISQLGLDNEVIRTKLREAYKQIDQLYQENQQLYQAIQEKNAIQLQMKSQLDFVTTTANALYEKIRSFKCRYYQQNAFLAHPRHHHEQQHQQHHHQSPAATAGNCASSYSGSGT